MEPTCKTDEISSLTTALREQNAAQLVLLKRQLHATRFCTVVCTLLFAAVLAVGLTVIPRLTALMDDVAELTGVLKETDFASLTEDIESLVQTGQTSLAQAADRLAEIDLPALNQAIRELGSFDIDTLNAAIADLQKLIDPLATFFQN